jgi:hypothetical protein
MTNEDDLRRLAVAAILLLRSRARWKTGKDLQHLEKRIRVGHLPAGTTIDQYNHIVDELLHQPDSFVYHYPYRDADYFGVVGEIDNTSWLLILSATGMMETAFPPKDLADYLKRRGFIYLGKMSEMIHE